MYESVRHSRLQLGEAKRAGLRDQAAVWNDFDGGDVEFPFPASFSYPPARHCLQIEMRVKKLMEHLWFLCQTCNSHSPTLKIQ
jgi:hypothetical protein